MHSGKCRSQKGVWGGNSKEIKQEESTQYPGEKISQFPITSAATVLNRFLKGNQAVHNSDENVSFSPSNTGDRHKDWHGKKYFRGRRWLVMRTERNSDAIKKRNCKVIFTLGLQKFVQHDKLTLTLFFSEVNTFISNSSKSPVRLHWCFLTLVFIFAVPSHLFFCTMFLLPL